MTYLSHAPARCPGGPDPKRSPTSTPEMLVLRSSANGGLGQVVVGSTRRPDAALPTGSGGDRSGAATASLRATLTRVTRFPAPRSRWRVVRRIGALAAWLGRLRGCG